MISLFDFFIGALLPPTDFQKSRGFVGWNLTVFTTNLLPHWDGGTFFSVFSIYASALAGDFTGATMSATLKDRKNILQIKKTSESFDSKNYEYK
jgi:solute carrier family 12 sodium/potassium/chloride transporter 2